MKATVWVFKNDLVCHVWWNFFTKHWCLFGRCFCNSNNCLMLNCQFEDYHLSVFPKLQQWRNFAWGCPWVRDGWVPHSPEKWLHNRIYCPSNRSKQIQESHTAYRTVTEYTRQSLNETQLGVTADNYLSVKKCRGAGSVLFFIQTLPRILCTGAISRVSFFDLFGPIARAINPII